MSSRIRILALLAACTALAGCFEAAKPISAPGTVPYDHTILGEVTAVAQHFVRDFARQRAIDQHAADRHLAREPSAVLVKLEQIAVFGEQDFRTRIPAGEHPGRDARMLRQLPVLAVNRHKISRAYKVENQL